MAQADVKTDQPTATAEYTREIGGCLMVTAEPAAVSRDATERTVRQMIVAQPDFALYDKRIEITDAATGHAVTTVWAHDVHPELCHTPTRGEDWF